MRTLVRLILYYTTNTTINIMKEIATKWSVNESLLQSYRSIFISAESFLLAVAVFSIEESTLFFYISSGIAVLIIWVLWFPIVRSRHLIVDYYKYALELSDKKREKLCSEREFVQKGDHYLETKRRLGIKSHWRLTRIKMDLLLPILFSIFWFSLVLVVFFVV